MARRQRQEPAAQAKLPPIFSETPAERLRGFYERMVDAPALRPRSKAEWLLRREEVRQGVLRALALAPMPDRLPLDVRLGGLLEREGYSVQRVYWQTWPKVWACGYLYLPASLDEPAPAILNPHGHIPEGSRDPNEQSRCISLAKLGYVALTTDSAHVYDYATGVSPLTVMTYQNLRALDYLASRPDVDRERLGIVGASGGSQQAMYLMAVDDRLRCAVHAVYPSYWKRILFPEGHHCPCNHVPGIMRVADELEICGIPSPRAMLFLTVSGDWTAQFGEDELGELRALYRLWQQPDRLAHRHLEGEHAFPREMREEAYTWFERELRGNRAAARVTEPEHEVEPVETLAELEARPADDRGAEGILDWYRRRFIDQPPRLESKKERKGYQERVRAELLELLGSPTERLTLETQWHPYEAPGVKAVSFRSERDVRVPALWLPAAATPAPVVLALHPEGKSAAVASPMVAALREAGYSVLAIDVRFRGELRQEWLHNCLAWGRPEAGMACEDVRAAVDWVWEREEVRHRRLVVLGEGDQGVTALLAAALDERVTATIADCRGTTYRDGGEGLPVIPNILRVADVPQLASLAAPRPMWLYNVPGERYGFSSRRYYDWTRRTYQSLGEEQALRITADGEPTPAELAAWLEARIKRAER